MIAPCKSCTDRHFACHDHCKKYQSYKKFKDAERKSLQKEWFLNDKPYIKKVQRNEEI